MKPKVAIVILAAGASSRMGVPKQLMPWGNDSLLNHVISTASTLDLQLHIILGAHGETIRKEIPKINNVHPHINPQWKEGIGSSIAFAISTLKNLKLDGVLFLLGDQFFVSTDYLKEIITHFEKDTSEIIVSEFHGNLGVPALFSSEYFNELSTLHADTGAKLIMKKDQTKVLKLNAEQHVRYIDTLEDYQKAHQVMFGI